MNLLVVPQLRYRNARLPKVVVDRRVHVFHLKEGFVLVDTYRLIPAKVDVVLSSQPPNQYRLKNRVFWVVD